MRARTVIVGLFAVGCATHRESPEARRPTGPEGRRCTLRIAVEGTFVDGEPMSSNAAVSHCKRTDGAMVVIEDNVPCGDWTSTCSTLRREGVAIYMRGPIGDFRQPIVAGNSPSTKSPDEKPLVRCSATCNDPRSRSAY